MSRQDKVCPEGKWEFNAEVAEAFDDMLERSIPQYQVMRDACFLLGCKFVKPKTDIVDLGCSRGGAIEPFIKKFGACNSYLGVETSKPMRNEFSARFGGLLASGVVRLSDSDLRLETPFFSASLVLCILTLQFTPIEYRLKILNSIYKQLQSGAALILVEKVIGATSDINDYMVDLYHALKLLNGYSTEDIDRKKLSLEGVLVPLRAEENENLLSLTGFRQIDCFWRWMNFAGWVAVK